MNAALIPFTNRAAINNAPLPANPPTRLAPPMSRASRPRTRATVSAGYGSHTAGAHRGDRISAEARLRSSPGRGAGRDARRLPGPALRGAPDRRRPRPTVAAVHRPAPVDQPHDHGQAGRRARGRGARGAPTRPETRRGLRKIADAVGPSSGLSIGSRRTCRLPARHPTAAPTRSNPRRRDTPPWGRFAKRSPHSTTISTPRSEVRTSVTSSTGSSAR